MANPQLEALADRATTLRAKLDAIDADSTAPGGHPDPTAPGADTLRGMEYRKQLHKEWMDCLNQLWKWGYTLDGNGNLVNRFGIKTSQGAV